MEKKQFTLKNASLVWWFIFWRTLLVVFAASIAGEIIVRSSGGEQLLIDIVNIIVPLSIIFAQMFFIKSAVNRDYKGKNSGNFRLSAIE